jgi:crotonobetainyl-CoA:carnitine CoA-transferase CaiB-like acyl-CoA transferase
MPGPLTGTRIVDLTAFVAGPLATQLLAEQGAEVVKIEPSHGDLLRRIGTQRAGCAAMFVSVNRNKRSVALDLRSEEGKAILGRLVARADVLVENFRPGTMEKMGFGPDVLCAKHPHLVYARVNGFGDTGPYRQMPVFDTLIQGFSGLAWAQGSQEGQPKLVRTLVADKVAPLLAAQAITAALLERERSGRGQTISVSMLDSLVWWIWPDNMMDKTFLDDDVIHAPILANAQNLMRTADGYLTVAPVSDESWHTLARLAGREDWLEDPRFSSMAARNVNLVAWFGAIQEEIETRKCEDWLSLLAESGVPHAPVHTLDSMLDDPQIRDSGLLEERSHPKWGRVRQPRPVARFERSECSIASIAPDVGEHTDEVLAELGVSTQEIASLRAAKRVF